MTTRAFIPVHSFDPTILQQRFPHKSISRMAKKIIVFADGTGNAFSTQESNVWRLYNAIDQSRPDQIAHYIEGVGTSGFKLFATRFRPSTKQARTGRSRAEQVGSPLQGSTDRETRIAPAAGPRAPEHGSYSAIQESFAVRIICAERTRPFAQPHWAFPLEPRTRSPCRHARTGYRTVAALAADRST